MFSTTLRRTWLATLCCLLLAPTAHAQGLPPIYQHTPTRVVPAKTVASQPAGTFLENVVLDGQGTAYITNYPAGQVLRLPHNSTLSVYATLPGTVAGVVLLPDGGLLVDGVAKAGLPTVWRVAAGGKTVEVLLTLPKAQFPNGMTQLAPNRYLMADSFLGAIWEINLTTRQASIWLQHPLLARKAETDKVPGVNGLKLNGTTLYASNTDRKLLLKIPVANGRPGTPREFVKDTNIDDFAFDGAGNLYGATHFYNSVVRVSATGQTTLVATAAQGVTGSTAVAFGRAAGDQQALYVVTNGGMSLPPPTGIEPAKVVRLDIRARATAQR
ncbi:SMP-30/gluconolactonase/LRE family protein [Hymenobacter terrenus]|uniref:SMP-30/gluconolactonase/LRE family protein n=1 Tax=Hymenobacter terrenus TaxID=1629124 RepID=UPI000A4F3496|nr:hypothetical protein [Hymenobacter terrenus]